jgi:hypothetical protein
LRLRWLASNQQPFPPTCSTPLQTPFIIMNDECTPTPLRTAKSSKPTDACRALSNTQTQPVVSLSWLQGDASAPPNMAELLWQSCTPSMPRVMLSLYATMWCVPHAPNMCNICSSTLEKLACLLSRSKK